MKILVVGGAGYIGSYMCKLLASNGHDVVVFDNLSTGYKESVLYGQLVIGDLSNKIQVNQLFQVHRFDAVMHFAANSLVSESIVNPSKYYRNNVCNTINLIDAMVHSNVRFLVFSSTAAIFGEPTTIPIDESHEKRPINPYGSSKLFVERILNDYLTSYGLSSVVFRYFNAAGADPEGELGERHVPETHLIPLVCQAALGLQSSIKIFGCDYSTRDGTCVRDYIHVHDICTAHLKGLEFLIKQKKPEMIDFNLGNGEGFTVQEVISAVQKCAEFEGKSLNIEYADRRDGDPHSLVANSKKAKSILGWNPSYTELSDIIKHAWLWEKKRAKTYKSRIEKKLIL